jgi:hypothetical protein
MRRILTPRRAAVSLLGFAMTLGACESSTEPEAYTWAGVYATATKFGGATGKWNAHQNLEVTGDMRVMLGDVAIRNPTVGPSTISWAIADGNATNADLTLMTESSQSYFWSSPVSGKLFQGRIQSPGQGYLDYRGLVQ